MEKGIKKVLIVDEFAILRKRLTAMLSKIMRTENVGQAEDAPGTINSIRKLDADAVIPDIRVPAGSQIDLLLETKRSSQTLPVIAPTVYPYRQYHRRYVEAGAHFFFDESTDSEGLMAVLGPLSQIRC